MSVPRIFSPFQNEWKYLQHGNFVISVEVYFEISELYFEIIEVFFEISEIERREAAASSKFPFQQRFVQEDHVSHECSPLKTFGLTNQHSVSQECSPLKTL